MKKLIMLLTITGASVLFGADRTLDVSFTGEDRKVLIRVSGSGEQNQTLIAAWANGDKGNDPLDWTEYADAGTLRIQSKSKMHPLQVQTPKMVL